MSVNNNTWYYLPLSNTTSNNSYTLAESVLNTSTIFSKGYSDQVSYGTSNYIAIPINDYGIICGTRVLPLTNGRYDVNIISSSGTLIDYYATSNTNTANYVNHVSIPGSYTNTTTSINMTSNNEYSILLVQQNNTNLSSMFINTTFNGTILPINNAFSGNIQYIQPNNVFTKTTPLITLTNTFGAININ